MTQVAPEHLAREKRREQDRDHKHEEKDHELKTHDLRDRLKQSLDGDFKSISMLDKSERSHDSGRS